ncbi:hypothetical protein NDU88_004966 [Pleurodeles waltl]|uniref:Uncharacterized protein n=1 Tax=Pleurodeles waltl TaxID=8319 RepID=A0AAV7T922_PLEWA|nr:hypothetical protein NDU88_004966 [Pleurodeles waltl]
MNPVRQRQRPRRMVAMAGGVAEATGWRLGARRLRIAEEANGVTQGTQRRIRVSQQSGGGPTGCPVRLVVYRVNDWRTERGEEDSSWRGLTEGSGGGPKCSGVKRGSAHAEVLAPGLWNVNCYLLGQIRSGLHRIIRWRGGYLIQSYRVGGLLKPAEEGQGGHYNGNGGGDAVTQTLDQAQLQRQNKSRNRNGTRRQRRAPLLGHGKLNKPLETESRKERAVLLRQLQLHENVSDADSDR